MNIMKIFMIRIYQGILRFFQSFIHFPIPKTLYFIDSIPKEISDKKKTKPIIVASKTVSKTKEFSHLLDEFYKNDLKFHLTTNVTSDPTIKEIESLYEEYKNNGCDSIVAVGGGSVIDAAKALGVQCSYPEKNLKNFKGVFKVHKKIPYFIAVPTTAGTGSECTVASVVTDDKKKDKFAINDVKLIPKVAVLDERLLSGLPPHIISITGIDALSHALEAYIGRGGSSMTNEHALAALELIHDNLLKFYRNPKDEEARKNMLIASYRAGLAFTRDYVGYVHALAHSVGGMYHLPHGLCISTFMPYVLVSYGKKAHNKLAKISDRLHLAPENKSKADKARAVIHWVRDLSKSMNIPATFDGVLENSKIKELAIHAEREANPLYPVPRILNSRELMMILIKSNQPIRKSNFEVPMVIGWRCKKCGCVYENKELPKDYMNPMCGHDIIDYEPVYDQEILSS